MMRQRIVFPLALAFLLVILHMLVGIPTLLQSSKGLAKLDHEPLPLTVLPVPKVHYASIYHTLCYKMGGKCCGGQSYEVMDEFATSFLPFFWRLSQTLPPLSVTERPAIEQLPPIACENRKDVFTGNLSAEPRVVFDSFLFNQELDALEARLYELDEVVDYFVLSESEYSHKAFKKGRIFHDNRFRYKRFLHKIIYLDLDLCLRMNQTVEEERRSRYLKEEDKWSIQVAMRECIWTLLQPMVTQFNNRSVIILSDIDEIPAPDSINQIKHCEWLNPYEQRFSLQTVWWAWFNMVTPCTHSRKRKDKSETHFNHGGNVTEEAAWAMMQAEEAKHEGGHVGESHEERVALERAEGGRRRRQSTSKSNEQRGPSTPEIILQTFAVVRERGVLQQRFYHLFPTATFLGGVHMQQFGSMIDLDYKILTHAESCSFGRWLRMPNATPCTVTDHQLAERQHLIDFDALYFFWEGENNAYGPRPLADEGARVCIPWVIRHNPARFAFAWANSNYSWYSGNRRSVSLPCLFILLTSRNIRPPSTTARKSKPQPQPKPVTKSDAFPSPTLGL